MALRLLSSRNADWHPVSSRSLPMTLLATSTAWIACACVSVPCPNIRPTRSTTTLTWSTDGLINEYIEPCEAIVDGKFVTVPAMEEREEFSLDGVTYEAFNTSGGLGTLAKTLEGRVRTMNYRTIRYPGHQAIIKALLNDLNLKNRRDVLKDLFENALPATMQDVVVIFVTVCGWKDGRYLQETYANKVYAGVVAGKKMSAIQITTAAGITTVLDLLAAGSFPPRDSCARRKITLADVLGNRFGRAYDPQACV